MVLEWEKICSIHHFMYVEPCWLAKNTYRVSQKFHRICVILAEKSIFSWFTARRLVSFHGSGMGKICFIHQFMYVEPHLYEKILIGCPKNAIEFMPFWLKNQYSPGSLLRHPVSFCGIGMGKIFSIHTFMYVEPVNTFSSTTIDRLLENI